ncbi:hypothetical protein ABPG75_013449 [Micractinium tetrahymenae]
MQDWEEQLWAPPVGTCLLARQAAAGGRLEAQLNSTAVWRPRFLVGAYVQLRGVDLGPSPPHIVAVKPLKPPSGAGSSDTAAEVFGSGSSGASFSGGAVGVQEELSFDCSFAWSSRMEVKLLFSLLPEQQAELQHRLGWLRQVWNLLKQAIVVKIGVKNMVVRGTLRLTLAPLLSDLPVVGAVRLSFLGPPAFSYTTTVYGGNIFVVPGLEAWINSFIRTKALAPFVFPQSCTIPLPGAPRSLPEGLLEVCVVEACGLPRMDWLGGRADPFVRLWVREESKFRTSVKSRTLSPEWDEQFTLIVHDTRFQALTLVLFDSDTLLPDEEIGRAEVPLGSLDLAPGAKNDLWLPVVPPMKRLSKQGRAQGRAALLRGEPSMESAWMPPDSLAPVNPLPRPAGGGTAASSAAALAGQEVVEGREDTARGAGLLQKLRTSLGPRLGEPQQAQPGQQAAEQQPQPAHRGRGFSLRRMTSRLPAALSSLGSGGSAGGAAACEAAPFGRSSRGCQVHIRCSFSAFTPDEVQAAGAAAARPGIVTILRRLSRQSRVPGLLRSGVLSIHLERAKNLSSRTQAGFTRNFTVKIDVGPHISRVTERGKVDFLHKRNPVFDESLELLVDGDTAASERTVVTLEIWACHFLRRDKFKGRAEVPLREVQRRRRIRGTWPLQDAPQPGGTLAMSLSWTAARGMY